MPTADTTSNWDLSPVFELLRSPTLPHPEPPPSASSRAGPTGSPAAAPQPSPQSLSKPSDCPRLGDFGLLWDYLGHGVLTTPTVFGTNHHENTDSAAPLCVQSALAKGLGKALGTSFEYEHIGDTTKSDPLTDPSKPGLARIPSEPDHVNDKTSSAGSPPTGPELESDGSASIFDRPLSRKRGVFSFIPSQVSAPGAVSDTSLTPPSSYEEPYSIPRPIHHPKTPVNEDCRVLSTRYRSRSERQVGLLTKLLKQFPDFAERVADVGRSPSSHADDVPRNSIHVFVDISNIMVGFHDLVKTSRNIPVKARIRRLPLSFHNFSLILERGRPSAKRVLVGSDRFPAITEAEAIGYETNILKRVQKVKGWTPRPFATKDRIHISKDSGDYSFDSAGGSGGSETDTAERWVEQGVDEILHLKMLESLVDTDAPSTIVLATGDAAVAEYSDGFMKMVTRALSRGWSVELVSFSQGTSYAYRKREFRAQWGSRFKIIMLDDYVEELLDM